MKNDNLRKILIDLGLSENEAKVYLSALALGPATILKISRDSQVKRTTIYSVIESLKHKGLINIELKGWKKLFLAENPKKLQFILDNKKKELEKSFPEFFSLYNLKGGEGFIKYYEGLEAIKSIYEGLIKDVKPHQDYYVISDLEQWHKLDPRYFLKFLERRGKLKINVKMLSQDSERIRNYVKDELKINEQVRILPAETSLTTNLVVTPQKVVIHQLVPPIMAMVIENKSIIQMNQQLFEIIWKSLEKNN